MSDAMPDITNAPYPTGFVPPPEAPVPTAEDVKSASTVHGAGIGHVNPPTVWWAYALGVAGVALIGGIAYAAYSKRVSFALPFYTHSAGPSPATG